MYSGHRWGILCRAGACGLCRTPPAGEPFSEAETTVAVFPAQTPWNFSSPPPRPGGAAPTLSEPGCPPYTRYTWPSSSKSLGPTSARGSQVSASRRSRNCSVRRAHHGSSCEAGCLRSASGLRPVRRPPGVLQGCLGTARPGAHRASVLVSFPWFPDLTERFVVGGGGFLRLSFSLCDLITALRCQVLRGQKWGWYYL